MCFGWKTTDTCEGDSGGPVICRYPKERFKNRVFLAGIVSRGIRTIRKVKSGETIELTCGSPGVPGIYTNVEKYIAWLSCVMKTRNLNKCA